MFSGALYLRRLHLVQTPWFAIMLHWIVRPDPQPDPHDHPVSFLSVVLRGGYTELRGTAGERHRVRWINWIPAGYVHRIIEAAPNTLTLAFAGPVVRQWGHLTAQGWVPWREYQKQRI